MKKGLVFLLVCMMLTATLSVGAWAEGEAAILVNGRTVRMGQPIVQMERQAAATAEALFEAMGAAWAWDEAHTILTAERAGTTLQLTVGQSEMLVNGAAEELGATLTRKMGTFYVPIAPVAQAFGATVNIDEESGEVSLALPEIDAPTYQDDPFHGFYYRIETAEDGQAISVADASADNGAAVITEAASEETCQEWHFLAQGDGYYAIQNKNSQKAMDIPSANIEEGAGVTQYTMNGGDNQAFRLVQNDDETYSLQAKHSELYLTVTDGALTQEAQREGDEQRFTLTKLEKSNAKLMGMSANLFLIQDEAVVSNAKLQWNVVRGATRYDVFRKKDDGAYLFLQSVAGVMLDDYDLELGSSYQYHVNAVSGDTLIATDDSNVVEPYELPDVEYKTYSNLVESGLQRPNNLYVDGVYYRFSQHGRTDGGNGFGSLVMTTSTDDITYGNEMEVLNIQDILESPTGKEFVDCKFESNNFIYNPKTNKFIWWSHFEDTAGYGVARVAVAYGTPGEKWESFQCFRPEGDDARDLNIYIDDDGSAYLITAIHVNADLAIYKLTEDWTDVESRIAIANYNSWRELPSVLKKDGIYYLFSSGTAGWYPTPGMYNTATSMAGPWSELKSVGNNNTFSSQSGTVSPLNPSGTNYLMMSYRWMYFWQDATNRRTMNRLFPVFAEDGYAFYDFYSEILYNYDEDIVIPVQHGRNLAQGKPVATSTQSETAHFVNDGNYFTSWRGDDEWPASWTVDLGRWCDLNEIQVSWRSNNGSEVYYNYKVEISTDGETFATLLDKSEGYTDYAFTVNAIAETARYVRLTLLDGHPRNSETNTYAPELFEVKVFGK